MHDQQISKSQIGKMATSLLLSLALLFQPMQGQQERHVYLPLVARSSNMSDWKIIVPTGTTNLILNPSAEVNAAGWLSSWGDTIARSSMRARFGGFSILVTAAGAAGMGAVHNPLDFAGLTPGDTVTFSAYVYMPTGGGVTQARIVIYDGGGWLNPVYGAWVTTLDEWIRIEVQKVVPAGGSIRPAISFGSPAAGSTAYFDAAQLEVRGETTTYCDGDQKGCEWLGTPHYSASRRSAFSRAGGVVRDLQDDYHLQIGAFIGAGMPPQTLALDSYAILPGGQLNSIKTQSRVMTLVGVIQGDNLNQVHDYRQELLDVLNKDAVPQDEFGYQPVLLRYTGADVEKEIAVHYEAGLETDTQAEMSCWERVAIRFLAPDPFWYGHGESAQLLDSNDAATLRYCAGRLRDTGQWDDLGLVANPTAGSTVYTILVASDGAVYFGGGFQGWNGVAGRNYLARYNPLTDTWSTVGAGAAFNGTVYALLEAPTGIIYIGGAFTGAGGAGGDYVAQYNPATNIVSPIAAGGTGTVYALALSGNGILYIGGSFINWTLPAADYIVSWNGAAYAALGTGMDNMVRGLAIDKRSGLLYATGFFTTAGGVAAVSVAVWNGTVWASVGGNPFNNWGYAILITDDGDIYVTGSFTVPALRITRFNGTAWESLGSGLNSDGWCLALGLDKTLFVGGTFSIAGGIGMTDAIAKWNGTSWAHLDADLAFGVGGLDVHAVKTGLADPVVRTNYDIWLGFNTSTTTSILAGLATANNNGSTIAYPRFVIYRSTSATWAILSSIRNETMGKTLLFDYDLLYGERLIIDTRPINKSIVSNFWGNRPDAILANSDFCEFALQPGDNNITLFVDVDVTAPPTIEAYMVWREAFVSNDK